MAVIPEFSPPSWLADQDVKTVHKRMMASLPSDIDNTEGGFPWDLTMPSALEKAELLEFHLTETLKIMHPMWAYGNWLDYHAAGEGLSRKEPVNAYGVVKVNGEPGTEIPSGYCFAVPTGGDAPAVEFVVTEKEVLDEEGIAELPVTAAVPGIKGNVPANAISIMVMPLKGITKVWNPEKTSGGSGEEEDDALRRRIMDSRQAAEASFVGCEGDYIRWAGNVDGVGSAYVMSQWDPDVPNSVKVVLLDANGEPANQQIVDAVYNYIMSPDNPIERKAPIGAIVSVVPPAAKRIDYRFHAVLKSGYRTEEVIRGFTEALQNYYQEAREEKMLRFNRVCSLLIQTPGLEDFIGLTVNGQTENVVLKEDEYPVTGTVTAEGTGEV